MEKKQILENNLSLDGVRELTVREGKALELHPPQKLDIEGHITAISSFLSRRSGAYSGSEQQFFDPSRAVALVDRERGEIMLRLNPNDIYGTVVTGRVLFDDDFLAFGINAQKMWNRQQLLDFLKFQRRWFADPLEYAKVMSAYQRLSLDISANIKEASDTRGNKEALLKKTVNSQNIPEQFKICMPIFKGDVSRTFLVDICIDTTDSNVRFWFESVELDEIVKIERELLIEKELKACEGIPVITV